MSDAMKHDDDDEALDRAYRAALAATTPSEDAAAIARRRQAVLAAVDEALAPAAPALPVASNEPRWRPLSSWWRGAAAASVLVCTALVALRVAEEPAPAPGQEAAAPAPSIALETVSPLPQREQNTVAPARVLAPPPAVPTGPTPLGRVAPLPAAPAAQPEAPAIAPPVAAIAPPPPAPPPPPAAPALADRAMKSAAPAAAMAAEGRQLLRLAAPAPRSPLAMALPASGLLAAVQQGDADTVQRLLAQRGPDDERDAEGRTALMLAVLRNDATLAGVLLQHGADRLLADRSGQTAQGYAQAGADAAMLKVFGLAP